MQEWEMEVLKPHLILHEPPGQEGFYSVREAGLKELAQARGESLKQSMLACLEQNLWPERFRPNRGSLDAAEQARLLRARVAVIGAGGLGGAAILLLARLGLGALAVADGDIFEESNLNRQQLANLENLAQSKAQAAARQVAEISPATEVRVHAVWAYEDNLPRILEGCDLALDCLDNLRGRYQLEEACLLLGLPYIHGAVAGLEGMVMTVRPGGPGLAALYGPEPAEKNESAEAWLGVPTPTPAFIASLQVAEAMKLLLGRPGLEPGQALHADLGAPSLEVLSLRT